MEPRFFSKEDNRNGAAEFKRCLPVNVNTSYVTLAPAIATVEQQRVRPILGAALFDEAAAYYATSGTTGENIAMNELVKLVQMATVRLAYWDSFDQLSVMMGDNGVSDTNGENRAYRYQTDALRDSLQRQGYAYLNQVVGFCMEHIDSLDGFQKSEYYSERKGSTIQSMREMEGFVSLGGDFLLFSRLRVQISETETMELPFRVGSTLAELLKTDRDTPRIATLLRQAQGFVAHWSMAEAVPFLNVVMTPSGPMVANETATGRQSGRTKNPPSLAVIDNLQQRHRQMAERYIGQLVTYCKQHVDTYPEIAEIGLGTDHEKTALHRDNRNKKTFLA